MYLHNVLFALTATIGFGSVMGAATEKDGAYLVTNYYNGTTVYKSLTNPQAEPVSEIQVTRRGV
jgi:hypothetical protein